MGTVIHKATIVTSFDADLVHIARNAAIDMFSSDMVTSVAKSPVNGYRSFAILTCGSKLGWTEEEDDTEARKMFAAWIATNSYEDGSNPIEFATVEYGRDGADTPADLIPAMTEQARQAGFAAGVEAAALTAERFRDMCGECHWPEEAVAVGVNLSSDIATAIRALTPGGYVALPVETVKMVEEALFWYAEQSRLARLIHSEGDKGRHAISADGGTKALAALAALKGAGT